MVDSRDKNKLNNEKTGDGILNHTVYEGMEFYPIDIIGLNKKYDNILLNKYPKRLKVEFSKTENELYLMNLCEHCVESREGSL